MNEDFLSYIWKNRLLYPLLTIETGESVEILSPGLQNDDGGPDFLNARIRIGDTTWAGNVEIHVKSSDWYRHGHEHDPAYRNAILHVVLENDIPVLYPDGSLVPTLVLNDKIPEVARKRFIQQGPQEFCLPCRGQLGEIPTDIFRMWAPALAIERLILKSDSIRHLWEGCLCNWDEAFYRQLSWCFGFRVNNTPFEMLAKSLPLKIIRQNCRNIQLLEALLFGQAGMLNDEFSDDYPRALQRDFLFLRMKYQLDPAVSVDWKFLRMRPSNFPTIRISQWACLLRQTGGRFFQLLEHGNIPDIFSAGNIITSEYWFTHYMFGRSSVFSRKIMGTDSINLLLINGIVPFLFFYGYEKDDAVSREKALGLLEKIPAERNAIIRQWRVEGISVANALESQALIHLRKHYCDRLRCLECRIGLSALSPRPRIDL